ncbi:MAG: MFS transporter [Chloroflexi bacterium]|nr:MFS transporter [Chloroflexota bacterium]
MDKGLPNKTEAEPHTRPYRWVMLALMWLLYSSFGLISRSVSPLVTPIITDLGISYSEMGLVLGSWQLTYIGASIIAGTVIDKLGVRRALFVGTIIMGLSAALRYFPSGLTGFLLAVSLLGVGGPFVSIGAPKTVALWFTGQSRGTAVGIYTTAPSVGGLFVLAATNSIVMPLTGYSWRWTFVAYGLVTFAIALVWWFFAKDVKKETSQENTSISRAFVSLLRVRNIRVLLLGGLLAFAIVHGFSNWLPKILESGGLSSREAGFAASLPLLVSVLSVLVIPRQTAPYARGRMVAVLATLTVTGLMLSVTTSLVLRFIGLVIFGVSAFCIFPLLMLILMDTPEVGARYMGFAGGIFFSIAEIGGVTGPLLMGALFDVTGSFLAGVALLATLSLIIFLIALSLKTPTAGH